jgi:ABC-type branched-subunit amino acid transport system permease subunit
MQGPGDVLEIALSLLLLLTANGAPVIACYLLGPRGAWRVDAGLGFIDQQPLFGAAKTWRGIAAALVGCTVMAMMLGYPPGLGVRFALYAMLGDLFSSFIKRRLRIAPSGKATGLDQLPEALLPLWLLRQQLNLALLDIVVVVLAFFILERWLSRLLYRWHIRKRPY